MGPSLEFDTMDPTQDGEALVGTIRSYSQTNRYGFIQSTHTPEDCYFQQKELPPSMRNVDGKRLVGQTVQFEMVMTPDGKPWATKVKLHKMVMVAGQMWRRAFRIHTSRIWC